MLMGTSVSTSTRQCFILKFEIEALQILVNIDYNLIICRAFKKSFEMFSLEN